MQPVPGPRIAVYVIAAAGFLAPSAPPLQARQGPAQQSEPADPGSMDPAMAGVVSAGPHLRLTPRWGPQPGDQAHADSLVAIARRALAGYGSPEAAEAAGYRLFAPRIRHQKVYHYTNYWNGFRARWSFDPAKPTSLLYVPGPDGRLRLIGAMYTMPADATLDDLDRRIPLSIASWHQHTNICLPPRKAARSAGAEIWSRYGPGGSISTREACEAAGGRFFDHLFGWMVHANVFAEDGEVWGDRHGHMHHGTASTAATTARPTRAMNSKSSVSIRSLGR